MKWNPSRRNSCPKIFWENKERPRVIQVISGSKIEGRTFRNHKVTAYLSSTFASPVFSNWGSENSAVCVFIVFMFLDQLTTGTKESFIESPKILPLKPACRQ